MMAASPVSATGKRVVWNSATPSSVSANRMKSTGIPNTVSVRSRGSRYRLRQYSEAQIGIAAQPSRRPICDLLRIRLTLVLRLQPRADHCGFSSRHPPAMRQHRTRNFAASGSGPSDHPGTTELSRGASAIDGVGGARDVARFVGCQQGRRWRRPRRPGRGAAPECGRRSCRWEAANCRRGGLAEWCSACGCRSCRGRRN